METHLRSYVAVYLLLRRENEILMLLRENTGYLDGYYSVIDGHVDGNESAKDAMIREAKEEAGIRIEKNWLAFTCVAHRKGPEREYIDFFFTCDKWEGEINNVEPEKCAGLYFIPENKLPENTSPFVRAALKAARDGGKYMEYGWEDR